MPVGGQAGRVFELRVFKPELRRFIVHHLHKSRPLPVPAVIGQRFGRVVSGAEKRGVYEFPDRDVFALLQIYAAALDSDRLSGDGYDFIQAPASTATSAVTSFVVLAMGRLVSASFS